MNSDADARDASKATFLQFVSGLAAQTLMHLGAMENPITGATDVDLPNARYSIDILAVLQEKTAGNLTEEEEEYLRLAIRDLRLRYIEVDRRERAAGEARAGED